MTSSPRVVNDNLIFKQRSGSNKDQKEEIVILCSLHPVRHSRNESRQGEARPSVEMAAGVSYSGDSFHGNAPGEVSDSYERTLDKGDGQGRTQGSQPMNKHEM